MNNTDKGVMPSALKRFVFSLLTALFAAVCTIAFYRLFHYAPFGSNSLASADANIQYLDFYAYLKDCMTGDNSLWYSFSRYSLNTGLIAEPNSKAISLWA